MVNNSVNYKIVGIRYPRYYDVLNKREMKPMIVCLNDKIKIKASIEDMLFDTNELYRKDYVLAKWANKLYICEPLDVEKKTFVKTEVQDHPYKDLAV